MRAQRNCSGFALILVLWTLVVLSAIALTLAASVGAEVRASQESWNDLQAERLAASGHEIAAYLETRSVGNTHEDLVGLPVQAVIAGLTYRVSFDIGSVDLVLEGENGKFDLGSANEDETTAFFTAWTGDSLRSREIAASIADWIDPNNDPRPFGGESTLYAGRDYLPRNGGLGAADLLLVRGLTAQDFTPAIIASDGAAKGASAVRNPLPWFIAAVPIGDRMNPNYASRTVLQTAPGMNEAILRSILEMRQRSIFTSAEDFRNRTGLAADAPLLTHLTFDRGIAPAILAIARLHDSVRIRTERRIRRQIIDPRRQRPPVRFMALVERNIPTE